jgi:hypothetical protein
LGIGREVPQVEPMNPSRSEHYLRQAIDLCGRTLGANRFELTLSQRRIAQELGLSISTMRRHIAAWPCVISDVPLCVDLDLMPNPPATAAARPADRRVRARHIQEHPLGREQSVDTNALALSLLETATQLLAAAVALLEAPEIARSSTDQLRASRAVATSQDSQSDFLSTKETDFLTTKGMTRAEPSARERTARDTARSSTTHSGVARTKQLTSSEDVQQSIAPLLDYCRRTNKSLPDRTGLQRLSMHDKADIDRAVRHVLAMAKNNSEIRSPFGLLINVLDRGEVPVSSPNQTSPPPLAPSDSTPGSTDPQITAVAEALAAYPEFWDTHIATRQHIGILARRPSPQALAMRLAAEFLTSPALLVTAHEYLGRQESVLLDQAAATG